MDISYAVRYPFEDKYWQSKLAILALLVFFSAVPLLGLIPLSICIGYLVQIVDNVRNGLPRPLPRWDNYNQMLMQGATVLIAGIIYNVPLLILNACMLTMFANFGSSIFGSAVALSLLCVILPITLIYSFVTWPMLAVGIIRYGASGNSASFYQFGDLFDVIRAHGSMTIQWVGITILTNIALSMIMVIPCIGWLVGLVMIIPIHGHLIGQFGLNIGRKPKPKRQ